MLRIPDKAGFLELWIKEIIDECMASASERGMVYSRAAQYYYMGAMDNRAAIFNKTKPFVDKLAGFLMQPTDVRFQLVYDSGEEEDVLWVKGSGWDLETIEEAGFAPVRLAAARRLGYPCRVDVSAHPGLLRPPIQLLKAPAPAARSPKKLPLAKADS